MQQDERSERSRSQILEAGLRLFSTQGFRATSVREIAEASGASIGNVYHHFADKEAIFRTLLNQFFTASVQPDFPINRALLSRDFPGNIEEVGRAVREVVREWRSHIRLIYVDVIEFDGKHIQRLFTDMNQMLQSCSDEERLRQVLPDEIAPLAASSLVLRVFFNHFALSTLFGVRDPLARADDQAIRDISFILRNGLLRRNQSESSS